MPDEAVSTKTSLKVLSDLAALAAKKDYRVPEVSGAPTEKHSAIAEAQGALASYAGARAKELDPSGDAVTQKDVMALAVPSEGDVDPLVVETELKQEVEARLDEHRRTGEPIAHGSPTAHVQAAAAHVARLREAHEAGRANFIGDTERGD